MNLIENLIKYTEYSKGDMSKKCKLEYEDINISNIDFSKFDLNNSYFGGVKFSLCNFSNVYLSGSNFGGSILKDCIFKRNIIKKASWDDMVFERTRIFMMTAFKTTLMFGKYVDTNFDECHFEKCSFANSQFINIYFRKSTFIDIDFTECKLKNVHFIGCKLENVKFDEKNNNGAVFFN